jgi:hypothetical protein
MRDPFPTLPDAARPPGVSKLAVVAIGIVAPAGLDPPTALAATLALATLTLMARASWL